MNEPSVYVGAPSAQGSPTSFVGNRVRLQRLRDAKFFSGWVVQVSEERVEIRMNGEPEIESGDQFAAEAHGATSIARFSATLVGFEAPMAVFALTSKMQYAQGMEQARYLVDGVTCVIFAANREVQAEVIDYSARGIGIRTLRAFVPGADVELTISFGNLSVVVDGQIRHCRLDPDAPGRYRAGVLIEPRDSEQAYTWDAFRARLQAMPRAR